MFCIRNTNGSIIGYTDEVNYIKISPTSGCYIAAKKAEAIGVAYKCKPYNLLGHDKIPDAPTVIINQLDASEHITNISAAEKELAIQLAETDEAAIELYEANLVLETHNAEQDEAIIEIYELMEGITNG